VLFRSPQNPKTPKPLIPIIVCEKEINLMETFNDILGDLDREEYSDAVGKLCLPKKLELPNELLISILLYLPAKELNRMQ